jgi:hypothetical protein
MCGQNAVRKFVATILAGESSDGVFSSLEEGISDVGSNGTSSLGWQVSLSIVTGYIFQFLYVTYSDDSDSLNRILEARGLVSCVSGHFVVVWRECYFKDIVRRDILFEH